MLRIGWILLFAGAIAAPAQAGDEIVLRHSLSGRSLETLAALVQRFNAEQKGKSAILLQDVGDLDAATRQRVPHLALLDDDDSVAFFDTRPRFKMLYQAMTESREKLDVKQFFPLVADAVDDTLGRLQALPLGLSLPVLMWNKDAYRKAGLDPDQAPRTWWELQAQAGSLYDAGVKCPYTSSRFAWVHMENLSSQHGEAFAMPEKHGKTRVALNRLVNVKHIALMASWYKSSYLHYFGSGNESDRKFTSGECAIFTGESSLYAAAMRSGFAVGVSELPYYDDVRGATPAKVLPDGAALWMLAGHKKQEYKVAARFVSFLLRPQIQLEWVRATGYLPMTPAAIEALRSAGVAPSLLEAAIGRLSERKAATTRTKHGGGLSRMRQILNEEISAVWANSKPAKEALDTAVRRFNDDEPDGSSAPAAVKR